MIERRDETIAVRLEKTLYEALGAHVPKGRSTSSVVRELIIKHLLSLHALNHQQIARLAGIHLSPRSRLSAMEFASCTSCGTGDNVFECPLCDTPTCRACLHTVLDTHGNQHCSHEDRTTLSRASSTGWEGTGTA